MSLHIRTAIRLPNRGWRWEEGGVPVILVRVAVIFVMVVTTMVVTAMVVVLVMVQSVEVILAWWWCLLC